MKKTYIIPEIKVVHLDSKAICQTIMVGSQGNGTDLAKKDQGWDLWGDDNDFDVE